MNVLARSSRHATRAQSYMPCDHSLSYVTSFSALGCRSRLVHDLYRSSTRKNYRAGSSIRCHTISQANGSHVTPFKIGRRHVNTDSHPPPPNSSSPPPAAMRQKYQSRGEMYREKNRALLMYSAAVMIATLGVTYAAVPLYRMFCAATGFAGTPNVGTGRFDPERLVPVEEARRIKVYFNADRSEQLPWSFKPQQKYVSVLPGETSLAFYTAKNNSSKDIIGIATYNVTPDRIAPYFSKVECFCFEEQKLLAGEEVDMPLLFFIDKDMLDDPACRNVESVVLSYTFFRARRNKYGQLEPDAADSEVQNSLGFGGYEHAPKVEERRDSSRE
ncbi:cytochrome c oxidase assembly protein cox11 [Moniliophthora roreri MCA 2997]|uniref:Cytochrome c oxidase assembly protein cox11 n=2 Tax=Moniliophthora roreri TaxID=221103 RepID=V2X0C6_MONRO|nr:cytochrome c oxidase assembly protein cox11 [Moniliophthora roreri MCA 2997]KAI3614987.1 cytochrome c oxidase assembly protein cox11 [Moniliophthora roreri]